MPLPDPLEDPAAWSRAAALGQAAVVIVARPANGLRNGLERLLSCGVTPIGLVRLDYATRPPAALVRDVAGWADLPVRGIFFDRAPASPYLVGPVVRAVRAAREAGLGTVVLNPGVPVDSIYRRLDATICTFEGPWQEYLTRPSDSFVSGDGHLVFDVPTGELPGARALVVARHAGLALATDRTRLWSGLEMRPQFAAAG